MNSSSRSKLYDLMILLALAVIIILMLSGCRSYDFGDMGRVDVFMSDTSLGRLEYEVKPDGTKRIVVDNLSVVERLSKALESTAEALKQARPTP